MKFVDLVGHPEKLFPLFPIEGDRKATEAVYGQTALLANLERHLPSCRFLQRFVLGAKPLNFRFQIFFGCHVNTDSTRGRVSYDCESAA
jgi:hypothetical protein